MYQDELEKCQCVPSGYTRNLTRNEAADVLGDGWNIDVITWFFSGLKDYVSTKTDVPEAKEAMMRFKEEMMRELGLDK